jgi:hypothetical protein
MLIGRQKRALPSGKDAPRPESSPGPPTRRSSTSVQRQLRFGRAPTATSTFSDAMKMHCSASTFILCRGGSELSGTSATPCSHTHGRRLRHTRSRSVRVTPQRVAARRRDVTRLVIRSRTTCSAIARPPRGTNSPSTPHRAAPPCAVPILSVARRAPLSSLVPRSARRGK